MEKAEEQKMVWAPQVRHSRASWVAKSSCTWGKRHPETSVTSRIHWNHQIRLDYQGGLSISRRDLGETEGGMTALLS